MKLLRYGLPHQEKPGILDSDGQIRDLSGTVPDITGEYLSPATLASLKSIDLAKLPLVQAAARQAQVRSLRWSRGKICLYWVELLRSRG